MPTEARKATTAISTIDSRLDREQSRSAPTTCCSTSPVSSSIPRSAKSAAWFTRAAISADSSTARPASITSRCRRMACRSPTSRSANYNASYFNRPDANVAARRSRPPAAALPSPRPTRRRRVQLHQPRRPAEFGGEIRERVGIEGEWSPTHRTDVVMGGPVARTGWVYSLGGFYRTRRSSSGGRYSDERRLRPARKPLPGLRHGSVKIYAKTWTTGITGMNTSSRAIRRTRSSIRA